MLMAHLCMKRNCMVAVTGDDMVLPFVNLLSFIFYAYQQGGGWYKALKKLLATHDCLSLILYCDEVTPGNPLASRVGRKCWVVYCAIKQMDGLLADVDAWVTLFIARSSLVQNVAAGMSAIMKEVLLNISKNPVCDVQHFGLMLKQPAGGPNVFLKLQFCFFLQDGQAMKMVYSVKGDSGSRFCPLCKNIFACKEESDELPTVCRFLKREQLQLSSDVEIMASWKRTQQRANEYKSKKMTAAAFSQWQQATGITWEPECLLASPLLEDVLQPCKQWVHDWLHCLLSNGIFAIASFLLLNSLNVWDTMLDYVAMWTLPKHLQGINIKALFEPAKGKKNKKSEKINATASELMTLEPVLTQFVEKVALPAGTFIAECEAYVALATLVQMFQGKLEPQTLLSQVERVLALWCAAGWQDRMIKKHHWLLHFPSHVEVHGKIASCFTAERKHKDISKHAVSMFNTTYFERGALDEVINQELHALGDPASLFEDLCLVKPALLPKKMLHIGQQIWPFAQQVFTGHTLKLQHGATVTKGDVVLLKEHANLKCCKVTAHLSHAGQFVSLVTLFSLLEVGPGRKYAIWKDTGDLVLVYAEQFLTPVAYSVSGDICTTLVPLAWR